MQFGKAPFGAVPFGESGEDITAGEVGFAGTGRIALNGDAAVDFEGEAQLGLNNERVRYAGALAFTGASTMLANGNRDAGGTAHMVGRGTLQPNGTSVLEFLASSVEVQRVYALEFDSWGAV